VAYEKGSNWERRKLHIEELHNVYFSSNIIRTLKENGMGKECSTYMEDEK